MTKCERRIGFVDYDADNFHANVYLAALRNQLKPRGFTLSGCTAIKGRTSRAWAKKNKVPYFERPEDLSAHVDFFMVLAPSNPEVHLSLCEKVFPFGKPTYVDKTFAPDTATAKKIFALADKHKVPVQTTSALRYTNVQAYVKEVGRARVRHMTAWGSGASFAEYAIHPVEMVISCMGTGAERLMRRGTRKHSELLIDFSGHRSAVVNVHLTLDTPYSASVATSAATKFILVDRPPLFVDTAAAILDFFERGQPTIPRAESMIIRRILDVAERPGAHRGFVKL